MESDYDIQYEVEEKLPHTVLKNITYYDEEENLICNAMLELFGHCTKLITYESNGAEWKGIRTITLVGSEFRISVLRKDGTDATVEINDNRYNMDIENLNVVIAYYNELNKEYINARIDFKNNINSIASDLLKNEAINGLLFNYIEQVSYHFFMNYKIIAGVESKIEDQNDIGKLLFISTEQLRLSIKITTKNKEGNTTRFYAHLENEDLLTEYKMQSFDLLVDFLTEELGIQDDKRVALYLTYKLLLEVAKIYFSNAWEKEYGNYFTDIKNLSLINATDIYCAIDSIDSKNLESTGTFIYFLMRNGKFNSDNYLDCYEITVDLIEECSKRKKTKLFGNRLRKGNNSICISIDAVDVMNGNEFEHFVADLFDKMGYTTTVTKSSGDQGIDVIAEKEDRKLGIHVFCK